MAFIAIESSLPLPRELYQDRLRSLLFRHDIFAIVLAHSLSGHAEQETLDAMTRVSIQASASRLAYATPGHDAYFRLRRLVATAPPGRRHKRVTASGQCPLILRLFCHRTVVPSGHMMGDFDDENEQLVRLMRRFYHRAVSAPGVDDTCHILFKIA